MGEIEKRKNGLKNDLDVTLVFMAAGMGKRFGGNKQLAALGPKGQSLMAYSAYDAIKVGYKRLIFILREEMVEEFMESLGEKLKKKIEVGIIIQDSDILPKGTVIPKERKKPLGTGHALYCVKDAVKGPFVILNADDLYGRNVLKDLFHGLLMDEAMVIPGYPVKNTLSEKGKVSRGIIDVDEKGYLRSIKEREKIWEEEGKVYFEDQEEKVKISEDSLVSMNIWGMQKEALEGLDDIFRGFLEDTKKDLLKEEFYLPEAMDALRKRNGIDLKIIEVKDRWMGMTYAEDAREIKFMLKEMVEEGIYPESLFGE